MKPSTQLLGQTRRQSQRKKRRQGFPAHGGDVAEATRQAAMSHGIRRVPRPPEVHVFQAEIGRDQGLMTARNFDHRTVIPDAGSAIQENATSSGLPADAGDQSFFMEGQDEINIAREHRGTVT